MQALNRALDLVIGSLEPEMTVLVIGPGMVSLAVTLAPLVRKVLCLDWEVSRLALAEHSVGNLDNVGFRLLNGPVLPVPDESADVTFAVGPLEPGCIMSSLADLARILKPGGRLYILHDAEAGAEDLRDTLITLGLDATQEVLPESASPHTIIYVRKRKP
ncbi:MAG: methyltransferase domain-containing protein [Anaerolineae bacterium]|nr:methyltransferase domain-containing protein [Anaerolineae bacterium]